MARQLSPKLYRLLIIRGLARAAGPLVVIWGIYDWATIDWKYALIFGALTFNFALAFAFAFVAPALLGGILRVRPWQTFIFIGNAFLLPMVYRNHYGHLPWGFIAVMVLFFVAMYVSTVIYLYLQNLMPNAGLFFPKRHPKASTLKSV